jgi:capsular polysaccharide transport system ATP-binding protein
MIELRGVSKTFRGGGVRRVVADRLSLSLPRGVRLALLGRNGAGKSSLLRIIAGTLPPDSGEVRIGGSVSWPVGFAGSFHPDLSGAQNTRFVARVHGVDSDALCDYVADFAGLGRQFHAPVRSYSAGMRARLAFGVSMGIDFDLYLVDEVTAVGDAAFRSRCEEVFEARMATAGAVVVSHAMGTLRRLCRQGAVLHEGRIEVFDDLEEAISRHLALMGTTPA